MGWYHFQDHSLSKNKKQLTPALLGVELPHGLKDQAVFPAP